MKIEYILFMLMYIQIYTARADFFFFIFNKKIEKIS